MKKLRSLTIILFLIFIIGCGQNKGNVDITNSDINVPEKKPTQQVREITIRAFQFGYDPSTIRVNQGDTIKLKLKTDDVSHGFSISEYGINVAIHPNKETVVDFVADKKGTFNFRCSIPCGSGHGGMTGILIVE